MRFRTQRERFFVKVRVSRLRFVARLTFPVVVFGRTGVVRSPFGRFLPSWKAAKDFVEQRRYGDRVAVREGSPLIPDITVGFILRVLARPFEEHGVGTATGAIGHAELHPR